MSPVEGNCVNQHWAGNIMSSQESPTLPPKPQPPPTRLGQEQKNLDAIEIATRTFSGNGDTAIKVENVCKGYSKDALILKNYNMKVPKGSIYALLGSSGCGKTTLLSCVVGRQTWDSGTISVLGSPPFSNRCSIDSKKIGYMPQDLALQPLLTIREIVVLYGRLYGMSTDDILERLKFLQNFLKLPTEQKVISNLSGGQQRRASLAVALLHEPDLIILDEPTVGLDPLLRQSIWEHLQDLVTSLQITIVLTTHYVDEARRSHMIGLMRHGRIIAEEPPNTLMERYNSSSLDNIVLLICKRDSAEKRASGTQLSTNGQQLAEVVSSNQIVFQARGKLSKTHGEQQVATGDNGNITFLKYDKFSSCGAHSDCPPEHPSFTSSIAKGIMGSVKSRKQCVSSSFTTFKKIKALIWSVYLLSFRHPAFIPLTFILPAVTSALVQFVFGSQLHDMKFGYVNNDYPFTNLSSIADFNDSRANCYESKFSHLFLSRIPSDSLTLIPFASKLDALTAVETGDIWGFVNIPTNFTVYMRERMVANLYSDNATLDGTIIGMHLDMSSYLGSILIIKQLYDAYQSFLWEIATSCNLPPEEFQIPMNFDKSIYGENSGSYAEQVVPGLLLVLIFILPLGALSVSVIQERKNKCLDRMKVAGLASYDFIITYLVTHGSFQVVQMSLCTIVLVLGFSYAIEGPILLYILVMCCNAFSGLAFGFVLGLLCATELQAIVIVFFIASFLLPFSGTFWPIEVLENHWRVFAYFFPTTLTSISIRSVMFRGLSYTHALVWPGIVFPILWMGFFLIIVIFLIRRY